MNNKGLKKTNKGSKTWYKNKTKEEDSLKKIKILELRNSENIRKPQ